MEGSLYNTNTLFVAAKETSVTFDPSLALQGIQQQHLSGIYQEEESVDFSALVDACENTGLSPVNFPGSGNGSSSGPLSSSSFFEPAESAFSFEDLMPGLNVYGSENGYHQSPSTLTDYTKQCSSITTPQPTPQISMTSLQDSLVGTDPAPGKAKSGKQSKKSGKNNHEYRDKRDRNNVAVRKSRIKSKQRVVETEKRVTELENENSHLQNKIALLTKELNVLKGLFASAGVPHPSIKMEVDSRRSD